MKLASIIVFLVFITAPILLRVSLIIWRLATQGVKGADSLFVPSKSLRLSKRKKKVVLAFAFLYFAAFIASGLWMLFEVTGDSIMSSLGLTTRQMAFLIVTGIVVFGSFFALIIHLGNKSPVSRIVKEMPSPEGAPFSAEYLAWQKRYADELNKRQNVVADNIGRHVLRYLALCFGVALVFTVVTIIIVALVH